VFEVKEEDDEEDDDDEEGGVVKKKKKLNSAHSSSSSNETSSNGASNGATSQHQHGKYAMPPVHRTVSDPPLYGSYIGVHAAFPEGTHLRMPIDDGNTQYSIMPANQKKKRKFDAVATSSSSSSSVLGLASVVDEKKHVAKKRNVRGRSDVVIDYDSTDEEVEDMQQPQEEQEEEESKKTELKSESEAAEVTSSSVAQNKVKGKESVVEVGEDYRILLMKQASGQNIKVLEF